MNWFQKIVTEQDNNTLVTPQNGSKILYRIKATDNDKTLADMQAKFSERYPDGHVEVNRLKGNYGLIELVPREYQSEQVRDGSNVAMVCPP